MFDSIEPRLSNAPLNQRQRRGILRHRSIRSGASQRAGKRSRWWTSSAFLAVLWVGVSPKF